VLMVACSIAKANVWEVSKVNLNFIYVLLAVLVVVTYVPDVPMSLVYLFYR
jgi:TRAP-type C4-dicarboxylate transport system permease large subunit